MSIKNALNKIQSVKVTLKYYEIESLNFLHNKNEINFKLHFTIQYSLHEEIKFLIQTYCDNKTANRWKE